jgi:hypothetical protein
MSKDNKLERPQPRIEAGVDNDLRLADPRGGNEVRWSSLVGRTSGSPMPTRRIYASWLPPNRRERTELLKLRRRQHSVIGWMAGLIPSSWIVALLAPDEAIFVPFTLLWIALGLWFAERVGATRCPRCGDEFCEKRELPYWRGLFNRRCENCGLSL